MTMTKELPQIFNSKGAFQELSDAVLDTLDDVQRATYKTIRQCAADLKVTDDQVAEAAQRVTAGNAAVIEMANFIRKNFPPKQFHDLWRETFGTPKA
jgi:hypothetical protein